MVQIVTTRRVQYYSCLKCRQPLSFESLRNGVSCSCGARLDAESIEKLRARSLDLQKAQSKEQGSRAFGVALAVLGSLVIAIGVYAFVAPQPPPEKKYDGSKTYVETTSINGRPAGSRVVSGEELNRPGMASPIGGALVLFFFGFVLTAVGIAKSGYWPVRDFSRKAFTLGLTDNADRKTR